MTETADFKTSVLPNTNSLPVHVFEPGFPDLQNIEVGIVFVHAQWSGSSIVSLRRLTAALQAVTGNDFYLFIVSTDAIDFEKFTKSYGKFPSGGGRGETFWIKNHSVVFADGGFYKPDGERLLEQRIAQFFNCENK